MQTQCFEPEKSKPKNDSKEKGKAIISGTNNMATLSSIPAPDMRPHSPYRPPGDKSAWSTKTNLER